VRKAFEKRFNAPSGALNFFLTPAPLDLRLNRFKHTRIRLKRKTGAVFIRCFGHFWKGKAMSRQHAKNEVSRHVQQQGGKDKQAHSGDRQAAKSTEPRRKKSLFVDKEAFLKGAVKELSLLSTAALTWRRATRF
jgi:hypothetical protein